MSEGIQRALAMYADIQDEWRREDPMAVTEDAVMEKSYMRGITVVVCGQFSNPLGFYDVVWGAGVFDPHRQWRVEEALQVMDWLDTHDPDAAGRISPIDVLSVLGVADRLNSTWHRRLHDEDELDMAVAAYKRYREAKGYGFSQPSRSDSEVTAEIDTDEA